VLLDEEQTVKKKNLVVTGNNRLMRGGVFAIITMVWFLFMFLFIDMDWDNFNPLAPFNGSRNKHQFIFYFICFSFFISSVIFSFVFYRNNLQPEDLLLRFAIVLIFLTLVFFLYSLVVMATVSSMGLFNAESITLKDPDIWTRIGGILMTFLVIYLLFYPFIMVFSILFYHGNFGLSGFILCFFVAGIFHVSLYLLMGLQAKLARTGLPVGDLIVSLFFTLTAFGIGVVAGEEKKKVKPSRKAYFNK
jgi:hypothetical protein